MQSLSVETQKAAEPPKRKGKLTYCLSILTAILLVIVVILLFKMQDDKTTSTASPSSWPSTQPSAIPSAIPSSAPSAAPSAAPTMEPVPLTDSTISQAAVDHCTGGFDKTTMEATYGPIEDWDTSAVTDMGSLFSAYRSGIFIGCNPPIGNWDVSSVTGIYEMVRLNLQPPTQPHYSI
jgi:hypothetical protein